MSLWTISQWCYCMNILVMALDIVNWKFQILIMVMIYLPIRKGGGQASSSIGPGVISKHEQIAIWTGVWNPIRCSTVHYVNAGWFWANSTIVKL